MVEVGSQPILWHIMKHYAFHGFNDFVIALGYRGDQIKRYMTDYRTIVADMTVRTGTGTVEASPTALDDWVVRLVDTGATTETGGRLKRLAPCLEKSTFMLTFGDGVSNVDLTRLVEFHRSHGKLATLTAVRPPARFGHVELDGEVVAEFSEKPQTGEGWINGGFFVLEPEVLDYIDGDETSLQREPLERLAKDRQLMAYRHDGFWQCMDTMRDKELLNGLWDAGEAPWKVWE
jgi:glucose-1-phosphate cytidylyltransferase